MDDNLFSAPLYPPPGDPKIMESADGHTTPLRRVIRVTNPQGLHMRPAAAFAQLARQFESSVTVWRHERSVNGKSWLDLLLLTAEPGDELIVEVHGTDAVTALPALADVLASEGTLDDLGSSTNLGNVR